MKEKKRYFNIILRLIMGLLAAIIVTNIDWGLDWDLYDFLFKIKGQREANPNIVLISVDDKTLKDLNKLFPLPVEVYSDLLKKICKEEPKVVAFDIEFNYETGRSTDYKRMAKIIEETGCKTLWGRDFIEGEAVLKPVPGELPFSAFQIANDFKREGRSPKRHMQYVRRVTPYWFNGKDLITSLAFKTAETYLGKDLVKDKDKWYEFLTDYAGPAGTYKTVSLSDVLSETWPKGRFADKIVLIGRGEKEYYNNYVRTPFYSGGVVYSLRLEVHANVTDTIINKMEIYPAHKYFAYALTYALSIFTVFILFGTSPLVGIVVVLSQFFVLLVAGLISLKFRYYISMIAPLLGVFISYYLLIPYRLVKEYRRRWEFQKAHEILSEVEKMKSNFLSLISHDLKTPIARIQGLAESLLKNGEIKLRDDQSKPVRAIIKNSEELNNFISRIIELSQVEASKIKLNLTSRDINSLIEENVEKLKYICKDKRIEMKKDLEPLFSIKLDEQLISQVIYNLLDNAVKYSPPDSAILIKSWEEEGYVKVSVADQGVGIKEEDLKNIFTKFFRGKDPRTIDVKGSGLGLYLVKYFVELHKGSITVSSELNNGSTFMFSLPLI